MTKDTKTDSFAYCVNFWEGAMSNCFLDEVIDDAEEAVIQLGIPRHVRARDDLA